MMAATFAGAHTRLASRSARAVLTGAALVRPLSADASDGGGGPPDDERPGFHQVPWVRHVLSGVDLARHPKYNKGLAFNREERDRLHLMGLLPPAVLSQELQAERVMINIRSMESDLQKYSYLISLQDRNERLFYKVLMGNIEELAPIVHVPTVGQACKQYGIMFRGLQRGLWISLADRGNVGRILRNWPETRVDVVVMTDGECVMDRGDLGVHGMGVCVSKLAMYTGCGGIHPQRCLPICIDAGTDNEELLQSPFYVGYHHTRVRGQEYDDLLEEIISEVHKRFSNRTFIQLEDFSHQNSARLLAEYRGASPVFDDKIQGTAVVTLASLISSAPMTGKGLEDHTFLFVGGEAVGIHIADILSGFISKTTGKPLTQARRQIWFVDSQGLVVRKRVDAPGQNMADNKIPYAHEHEECEDLSAIVDLLKPTVLIGTPRSRKEQRESETGVVNSLGEREHKGIFHREILEKHASHNEKPIILALSTPPECTADEAYTYTKGRGIYIGGGYRNFTSVMLPNNMPYKPSSSTSAYVFPGLALGHTYAGSTKIHESMLTAAAVTLANMVTEEDRQVGAVLPPFSKIRKISCKVAKAVAVKAYDLGLATRLPRPVNLFDDIKNGIFDPTYTYYS